MSTGVTPTSHRHYVRPIPRTLVLGLLPAVLLLAGCPKREAQSQGKPQLIPAPVTVTTVARQDVPWRITTFGTIEPFATVAMKSMVTGQITKIHFTPGQQVSKGDTLISIDSRPFEATLKQDEANLAQRKILTDDSLRQAELKDRLHKVGVAPEDEMKRIRAAAAALQAGMEADKASIDKEKLNIEYCTIKAPFDGRVGDILLHEGSVIKANDVAVVELVQTKPLYVTFSAPQTYLAAIKQRMTAKGGLAVEATTSGEAGFTEKGILSFVNNTVDVSTGTIKCKATFENADEKLWPGQFVNVVITLGVESQALAVPSQVIQSGQKGQYVFVVKPDSTAELRLVKPGLTCDNMTIIKEGLSEGETVVVDGHLRVTPGAKVEPKNATSAADNK